MKVRAAVHPALVDTPSPPAVGHCEPLADDGLTIVEVHGRRSDDQQAARGWRAVLAYIVWALRSVRRISWRRLSLSSSPDGVAIDRLLRHYYVRVPLTRWKARIGQSVLELPPTWDGYISTPGHSRARRRANRASAQGYVVRPLDAAERRLAEESLLTPVPAKRVTTRGVADTWLGGFSPSGELVSVAIALIDGDVALLHTAEGVPAARGTHVRYLVHAALVKLLIERNVCILLTDAQNCFRIPLPLLLYQHQLGYELRNVLWQRAT